MTHPPKPGSCCYIRLDLDAEAELELAKATTRRKLNDSLEQTVTASQDLLDLVQRLAIRNPLGNNFDLLAHGGLLRCRENRDHQLV